jgi:glycosyltransferase involved in cell wall biosynthesis
MKILIVSSGLRPHHFGGLPSHVEDLLRGLAARGIDVAYLNTGARTGRIGTHLSERASHPWRTWILESRWGHTAYWNGTVDPADQFAPDAAFSDAVGKVAHEFRPDIVHFHEFTSFPIAAATIFRDAGASTVFSAHDFFALCPTTKLLRRDGTVCDRSTAELDCDMCSKHARPNRQLQIESAWDRRLSFSIPARNVMRRLIRSTEGIVRARLRRQAYQSRRSEFTNHLARFDAVLMTSVDQMRRFGKYGAGSTHLRLLPLSRTSIASTPHPVRTGTVNPDKTTFLALNIVNAAKGLALLEKAFASVASTNPDAVLHLYGPEGPNSPGIRRMGKYLDSDLDCIAETADFGILPSIWPEAYGYVGPEMLSRGLPVLASNIGAMPDYVVDESNGLLFDPALPESLARAVRRVLKDDELRNRLWHGAVRTPRRFLTISEHLDALVAIYSELFERRH